MDEYNSGMDPEIKRFFLKIVRSFTWSVMWLLGIATAGIFFKLGEIQDGIRWFNLVFYIFAAVTFFLLLRYYYKTWIRKA